jgi:glycogen operon protein
MTDWSIENGTHCPYGATWLEERKGYNFSICSKTATRVHLLLFQEASPYQIVYEYEFDPFLNKTGAIWHCFVPEEKIQAANCYAYRIDGPNAPGNRFNFKKLLLDPWAKAVFFPPDFSRPATKDNSDNIGKAPLGLLFKNVDSLAAANPDNRPVHYHDLIIYELHVKGFTQHSSSGVQEVNKGKFSGVIDKIPYLTELGVTAVELMPVHQFDINENNYWGYMTLNFFAPHNRYCVKKAGAEPILEFKKMVQALHDAGIEVILDVIYNHSSEGDDSGPFYSYKGIDNSSYYLLTPDQRFYNNDAGTGNVLRTSNKTVRKLMLDSLRYWVEEMKVDGFRFDLATIFTRNDDGSVNTFNPPILEEISMDPILSKVRLIAEPWDIASYQLGSRFPGTSWGQWNGEYRDEVRRFVKSDNGLVGSLMARLYGSDDLFPDRMPFSGHPFQSINFITAHDGFTLYDMVSYNQKHNEANGYNNTDGSDTNHSWNCNWEGDDNVPDTVIALRKKQAKNFTAILMLSNGVPMFRMGDEFLHTQSGNNNAFNQDNSISWLNWKRKETFSDIFRFFKMIISFRKKHPSIHRAGFWKEDVKWFGVGKDADLSFNSHTLAFYLDGKRKKDSDLYVMINAYWEALNFEIQTGASGEWKRIIDTSLNSPDDIVDVASAGALPSLKYTVAGRSIVVLERAMS